MKVFSQLFLVAISDLTQIYFVVKSDLNFMRQFIRIVYYMTSLVWIIIHYTVSNIACKPFNLKFCEFWNTFKPKNFGWRTVDPYDFLSLLSVLSSHTKILLTERAFWQLPNFFNKTLTHVRFMKCLLLAFALALW